ncbi:MAG: hypothetical protein M3Y27_00080 [Acidobacteriota bacterium]|nr:hypothetical protein [Acidobacteriota bacterium]
MSLTRIIAISAAMPTPGDTLRHERFPYVIPQSKAEAQRDWTPVKAVTTATSLRWACY